MTKTETNALEKKEIGKWYTTYIEEASMEKEWEQAKPIHEFIMRNYGKETPEKIEELEKLIDESDLTPKQERYFIRALKWMKGRAESDNADKLGRIIRLYREQKKMTLRDLAKSSGVSPSYINKIENGKRLTISLPVLKKIAKGLGQEPEIFIRMVSGDESRRPSLRQVLEGENYTIDGQEVSGDQREALVGMIQTIIDADFKESVHIDTIEIMNAVAKFKEIQNRNKI